MRFFGILNTGFVDSFLCVPTQPNVITNRVVKPTPRSTYALEEDDDGRIAEVGAPPLCDCLGLRARLTVIMVSTRGMGEARELPAEAPRSPEVPVAPLLAFASSSCGVCKNEVAHQLACWLTWARAVPGGVSFAGERG